MDVKYFHNFFRFSIFSNSKLEHQAEMQYWYNDNTYIAYIVVSYGKRTTDEVLSALKSIKKLLVNSNGSRLQFI